MQLDEYFSIDEIDHEVLGKVETIRIKGSRIGIEFIIEPYLGGDSPERIYQGYRHSLTLEQVYATITYYLHNKARIDAYLRRGKELADYFYQEHLKKEPTEVDKRLKKLKDQTQTVQ